MDESPLVGVLLRDAVRLSIISLAGENRNRIVIVGLGA